jgi:inositol-phosphate phosphatase/L-galactose 1-phosphate phosphatase/histidinol-phosphatase
MTPPPSPRTPCPSEFIAFAGALADAAATVTRRYFRTRVEIDDKGDASPVTIADREAEAAMRTLIAETYPGHGIFGEEHGRHQTDAEYVWVLDPIDGTRAFITGKPSFGTLIALVRGGVPILGVIDQPIIKERWLGASGRGTTLNDEPARVRACAALDAAYMYATAPEMFAGGNADAWARLSKRVKLARYGADCYAYGLLASGFVDLVVEADLKPYDYCALVPVIEGAGGMMTDWQGRPLDLASDGRVVAAGDPRMHSAALDALAG